MLLNNSKGNLSFLQHRILNWMFKPFYSKDGKIIHVRNFLKFVIMQLYFFLLHNKQVCTYMHNILIHKQCPRSCWIKQKSLRLRPASPSLSSGWASVCLPEDLIHPLCSHVTSSRLMAAFFYLHLLRSLWHSSHFSIDLSLSVFLCVYVCLLCLSKAGVISMKLYILLNE